MRIASALAGLLGLSACGVADQFADREMTYDRQAELVRDRAILLNVLRAAERRPLLFVDVGQVTGSANVSGTGALSLPVWVINSLYAPGGSASPSVSVSGGPTFSLTPLVSKEFYQGILSPVPSRLLADLAQTGLPLPVLLPLVIQRITLTYDADGSYRRVVLPNDFFRDDSSRFASLLDSWIRQGFTIEASTSKHPVGPELTDAEIKAHSSLWGVLPNGETLEHVDAKPGHPAHWQIETSAQDASFCFHPADPLRDAYDTLALPAGFGVAPPFRAAFDCPGLLRNALRPATIAHSVRTGPVTRLAGNAQPYAIEITTRSVEQIFYYIGELTRARLHFATDVSLPRPAGRVDLAGLFTLRRGIAPFTDGAIAIAYAGHPYWVATDPTGRDRTTQVMELLTQLTALNDSAKDLPAPSALTLVPH